MQVFAPRGQDESTLALVAASALALVVVKLTHSWIQSRSRPKLQGRDKDGNVVPLRKIPMPASTLPILGNLMDNVRNNDRILDWVWEVCAEFNYEPWKRKIPGQPDIVTVATPDAMEEITTTQFDNFEKGKFQLEIIEDLFGHGLLASDGERWYHQRKTAAKFFSARSLRAFMTKSMHKNMEQVCDVLEHGVRTGDQVDLKTLFHEFTLQTFVEMGLGVNLKWIGAKDPHPFQQAIDTASPLISRRFRRPQWLWKLEKWLNIGPERVFTESMNTVYSWLHEVIDKSLSETVNSDKPKGDDDIKSVVELFAQNSRDDADGLRSQDLADFVLTFIIAARDTTATTLAWLFYELDKNPHVLAKIREEMATQLPAHLAQDKNAYLTTDHTRNLIYLEATIKEILRWRPAAPGTVKQVVRDTVICGDVPLYKGQVIILSAFSMARNPNVWGPDACEFKPERWIDTTTGELIHVPASKFFTFHAGPRTCIGMNLAMLELRVVAANLLHRFRFEIDPSNDGSYVTAPTHVMRMPLLAKVHAAE